MTDRNSATTPSYRIPWFIWMLIIVPILVCGIMYLTTRSQTSDTPGRGSAKPDLPLTVTWRPSSVGQGRVLIVANHSDAYLHGVTITMHAPDGQRTSRVISTIAPHEEMEIGWLEMSPWVIEPGETATFSHPDFKAVNYVIP
jgi:hypothetical protein